MSALPPIADIHQRQWHVRYVPEADIRLRVETSAVNQPVPFAHHQQLGSVQLHRDLVHLACEREGHLVVVVINGRSSVGTDVEGLAQGHDEWNGVRDLLIGDFLAWGT